MYEQRFYREWMEHKGLKQFRIVQDKSDLLILASLNGAKALATETLKTARAEIEGYITTHPEFLRSLAPVPIASHAPSIVKHMGLAGDRFNVGPMAAVAGTIAEVVGKELCASGGEVIVENGGDIFARVETPMTIGLYAGEDSPFKDKLAFRVDARGGIGVCTSSGKVGPSISFGQADAVVAVSKSTALADAAATSIANQIRKKEDIDIIVEEQKKRGDLDGLIACLEDRLGIFGDIEITRR